MKKRLEDIFYLFAYGVNDLSHLLVLIIFETINVLMAVDASCRLLLLFLSGSSQESYFSKGEKRRPEMRLPCSVYVFVFSSVVHGEQCAIKAKASLLLSGEERDDTKNGCVAV